MNDKGPEKRLNTRPGAEAEEREIMRQHAQKRRKMGLWNPEQKRIRPRFMDYEEYRRRNGLR